MISVFNFDVSILSLPVKMYPSLNLYVTKRARPFFFCQARGRKISEKLKKMIREELRTIYEGNVADYAVHDYNDLTDNELIARANEGGMEEILVLDGDGGLANRDEVIQQLHLAGEEYLKFHDKGMIAQEGR